jgi:hypothetical protein
MNTYSHTEYDKHVRAQVYMDLEAQYFLAMARVHVSDTEQSVQPAKEVSLHTRCLPQPDL